MNRWSSRSGLVILVGAICLFLAIVGHASAEQGQAGSGGQSTDAATQAMIAAWHTYALPNDNHKILDPLVGTWSHVAKWWMSPDSQPEMSQGTNETAWEMGGRFLVKTVKATSMGQPFEGMGLTGFDNGKQTYQTIWMDNMGTGMMIGEGTYDPGTKTLTDHGRFTDPFIGQRNYRGVVTLIDDDHHSYEMYVADKNGKEFRMMEILYTRSN